MNTVCPHCLALNRLPENRSHDEGKCGRCHETLFTGKPVDATLANFDVLLKDNLPVIVDFWAPWCGPCLNFAPIFSAASADYASRLRFIKVNTEAENALSTRFQIRSIPTLMVFKNGQRIDMLNGALSAAAFRQWIDRLLSH